MNQNQNQNRKVIVAALREDRELKALFTGIIISAIGILAMAITAGIWYF